MDELLRATYEAERGHLWYRGFRRFVEPFLAQATQAVSHPRILDCGCGTGANLPMLGRHGLAFGFDLTWIGLSYAASEGHRRIACATAAQAPYPDGSFDVATSFDVLYCLEEEVERAAITEMYRLVRPGGAVVVNVPAMNVLRGDHSIFVGERRRYSRDRIGSFTLSATVRNDGDGAAAATTLRYYRSTDETITTSDTEVGTAAVGGLAAGATSSESINLTAPATAGTYYYGACVDAVTDESDTTNNCSTSVQVTVPEPTPTRATQEFHVWGDSGYTQYLGFFSCVFCTELDANSINNEFGPYGNRFSSTSIRNEFSQYGSRFGTHSACNRFTSNPPRVFNQSKTVYYGELTLNEFRSDAISELVDWLEEDVCP